MNGSERSHVDWDIENGTTYHYRVFCYNELWTSDPADTISIEVPPEGEIEPPVVVDQTGGNVGLIMMVGLGLFFLALVAVLFLIFAVFIITRRQRSEDGADNVEIERPPPLPPTFPRAPPPPMYRPQHGFILEDGPDNRFR
jgi:hypothetical protein